MNMQAGSQFGFEDRQDEQPPRKGDEGHPGQAATAKETSQAERAAMHPEPHDVEWQYYFGAWSH